MKRSSMLLISVLGLAFLNTASVFAKGGGAGNGVQDRLRDPSAVMQQDRLRALDKDQLRAPDRDQSRLRDQDFLRAMDKDQLKLRDQDRVHVPR